MPLKLAHDLRIDHPRDAQARQDFVVSLRGFVLDDMAAAMKDRYETRVRPSFAKAHGRDPATEDEVHDAMRGDTMFRFYSSTRYNAQEMCWRSVIPVVADKMPEIEQAVNRLSHGGKGSLELDPALETPENVFGLDVHLMPGGYVADGSLAPGAVYDNGLTVFTAGLLGPQIDDIGQSMANLVRYRFPDFKPRAILDAGCTIGHNCVPWKQVFPDAEVYGVDVSGPAMRYGHARAESLGEAIHFKQMDATEMTFEDESFDVVFSSQFLHELSLKDTARFLAEARRILRPGGMIVTMELPPNKVLQPYDQFYLDWDSYYNKEPFYRTFRDQDPRALAAAAGFADGDFLQFAVPQYTFTEDEAFAAAVNTPSSFNGDTGRLSSAIHYFAFILRKD